jgi:hypothetical protein
MDRISCRETTLLASVSLSPTLTRFLENND